MCQDKLLILLLSFVGQCTYMGQGWNFMGRLFSPYQYTRKKWVNLCGLIGEGLWAKGWASSRFTVHSASARFLNRFKHCAWYLALIGVPKWGEIREALWGNQAYYLSHIEDLRMAIIFGEPLWGAFRTSSACLIRCGKVLWNKRYTAPSSLGVLLWGFWIISWSRFFPCLRFSNSLIGLLR